MTIERKLKTTKPALFALAFISFFVKFEFYKQKVFLKAEFKSKIYTFFEFCLIYAQKQAYKIRQKTQI